VLEADVNSQKESIQQRLAERKKRLMQKKMDLDHKSNNSIGAFSGDLAQRRGQSVLISKYDLPLLLDKLNSKDLS
jgi:hypothetical protein